MLLFAAPPEWLALPEADDGWFAAAVHLDAAERSQDDDPPEHGTS